MSEKNTDHVDYSRKTYWGVLLTLISLFIFNLSSLSNFINSLKTINETKENIVKTFSSKNLVSSNKTEELFSLIGYGKYYIDTEKLNRHNILRVNIIDLILLNTIKRDLMLQNYPYIQLTIINDSTFDIIAESNLVQIENLIISGNSPTNIQDLEFIFLLEKGLNLSNSFIDLSIGEYASWYKRVRLDLSENSIATIIDKLK